MASVDHFAPDAKTDTSSGVISAYLDAYTAPEGVVVDPFCQSSTLVLEAVRYGRRVVAANLNPLDALRTRVGVTPLAAHDFAGAVTRLSDSPKLDASLQEHLQRLYRTSCPRCTRMAVGDYFIWERGLSVPKQVHYRCPACGEAGLRDCDESDVCILQAVEPRGLHYWYVLDRVAKREDRGHRLAEKLLELYTPRNLYALSNLVLKAEDLFGGSLVHDFVRLVLLQCLESGSKLHAVPGDPILPHAGGLTPPPRFAEWNVWQLFEDAVRQLAKRELPAPVPLGASIREVVVPGWHTATHERAPTASGFVGNMSVRQLTRELPPGSVSLVLTQPPQLGHTRWALPYLWTGWLYGRAASASLWPVVRRRSSDWPWYLRAMQATLRGLQTTLTPQGRIVFLAEGKGLAYLEATTLAAAGASLRLQSALYHPRESEAATRPFAGLRGDYRQTWMQGPVAPPWPMSSDELWKRIGEIAVAVAEEALQQRGEPVPFVRLHCAIWEALARRNMLQRAMSTKELLASPGLVREHITAALAADVGPTFEHLWKDEERDECLWWLARAPAGLVPLTERVEEAVRESLESVETALTVDLMHTVYMRFPGVLTPDDEWVMACLKSYGREVTPGRWILREADQREQRARARDVALRALDQAGHRLGYDVKLADQGFDVQWTHAGQDAFAFVVLDSLALSRAASLSGEGFVPTNKFIVIPEARQNLLHLKLARFPWLRKQLTSAGWQFMRDVDVPEWASKTTQDRGQLLLV